MIPLVAIKKELTILKDIVDRVAKEVCAEAGVEISHLVGTMIELPRACLRAGEIAEAAEFFSFGTNDLTQTAYGLSRDDAARFLQVYERSEEHTSELQSLMRISYAVFCLKKKHNYK